MRAVVTRVEGLAVSADGERSTMVALPIEAPLQVQVNGTLLATLMRLPGHDRELVAGHLLTAGAISGPDDIAEMLQEPDLLRITLRGEAVRREARPPAPLVEARVLMALPVVMAEHQPLRDQIGVLHAAGVFDCHGELLAAFEDVGRHNALDKALGHCLLAGHGLGDTVALTTGRGTAELVTKAAAAGLAVLCTGASVTSLGVQVADRAGLTLVARLRADGMEVFSHPVRIIR